MHLRTVLFQFPYLNGATAKLVRTLAKLAIQTVIGGSKDMKRDGLKQSNWRRIGIVVTLLCISFLGARRLWVPTGPSDVRPTATLASLLAEGHELHESLRTRRLEKIFDLPTGGEIPQNPHVSTDDAFVEAMSRGSSQGRLDRAGILSALYARYAAGEIELICYGLEAKSDTDANRREKALREIWAYTAGLGRARVHRRDRILVVIWHGGLPDECWETVNARVLKRLGVPEEA